MNDEISKDQYGLHLLNTAAIGVRLGKPTEEMVADIKAPWANRTISDGNVTCHPNKIAKRITKPIFARPSTLVGVLA
jgi:hypothetical protein